MLFWQTKFFLEEERQSRGQKMTKILPYTCREVFSIGLSANDIVSVDERP